MNQTTTRTNGFATASLVMGIIALVSVFTMTVIPAMICGSLSIIFGVLSRGDTRYPSNSALIGIIASVIAIIINLAVSVFAFYMVFTNPDMTQMYRDMLNETYEQTLGFSFDDLLEEYGLGGELE